METYGGSGSTVNARKSGLIWRGSSGLVKQKVTLKDEKKNRKQIHGKCNDISSADENK
jgi:hypothetical protein